MKLVYINPNESGSRPAIQDCNFSSVPAGMAIWPDELDTAPFYENNSFVKLTFEEREIVVGQEQVPVPAEEEGGEPTFEMRDIKETRTYVVSCEPNVEARDAWKATLPPEPDPVIAARAAKEEEMSAACNAAIVAGMDVETSVGTEHFSLQETDQINLTTATNAVQNGAAGYPYHADGSLCRMFSADEILAIANAATQHKLYHTTLCNHLLTWARRAETIEEIEGIAYDANLLPEDLAQNMANIFASAAAV